MEKKYTILKQSAEESSPDQPKLSVEKLIEASSQNVHDEDWYSRRDELKPGMVFRTHDGLVKLDRRKPGDGTDWVVQTWYAGRSNIPGYERGFWCCDEDTIHPSDLVEIQ